MGVMFDKAFQECLAWYTQKGNSSSSALLCTSRDVFQGRLDHLHKELLARSRDEAQTALLAAVAGEIGNNCFDHNLGQWQDVPGCWFQYGFEVSPFWILIADRGQGILSSLKRVAPSLNTDQEALETAFSKKLSGRSPERRGNGLKFVRSIINSDQKRGLLFISGKGSVTFGGWVKPLEDLQKNTQWNKGQGAFVCMLWSVEK